MAECGVKPARLVGRVGNLPQSVAALARPLRKAPRVYSAKDAARIICYAVGAGADPDEIREMAGCCLSDGGECAEVYSILEKVIAAGEAVAFPIVVLSALIPALALLSRIPLFGKRLLPLLAAAEAIDLAASEWSIISREATLFISKRVR